MRDISILVSFLCLFILTPALIAQNKYEQSVNPALRNFGLSYKNWDTNNGLPDNNISDLVKDEQGFLWMITDEGLVRFDGSNSRVFNYKNIPVLQEAIYKCLSLDRFNNLYFLNGPNIIRKDIHNNFSIIAERPLETDLIGDMVVDSSGTVWLGTLTNGLYKLIDNKFVHVDSTEGLNVINISYLKIDRYSNLWACAGGKGVFKYENGKFELKIDVSKIPRRRVRSLFVDKSNRIWIGTNEGLLLFDTPSQKPELITKAKIIAIEEDSNNNLWLASIKNGIFIYSKDKLYKYDALPELINNGISNLDVDNDKVWIGSVKGGVYLIEKTKIFTIGKKEGLNDNYVNSVYEDVDGSFLIGTANGIYKSENPFSWRSVKKLNILQSAQIYVLKRNSSGDLMVGTHYKGLFIYKKNRTINYNMTNGLRVNFARCTFEDSDGSLWVGTNGKGITIFKDGEVKQLNRDNGLSYDLISFIHKAHDGRIWIGTTGGGINIVDKNGNIKVIDKSSGLTGNIVSSIYEEPNSDIWLTINGGGVTLIQDDKITNFTTKDGLYSNRIYNMVCDLNDRFWFSTTRGIFSVTKKEFLDYKDGKRSRIRYSHFDKSDGMITNSCVGSSPQTTAFTKNGLALFSTSEGLVIIDPKILNTFPNRTKLYIDRVFVNHKQIKFDELKNISPSPDRVEFYFGAINYQNPHKLTYKCKLSNIDKEWIELEDQKSIGYSHLPYGEYDFELAAYDPGSDTQLASTDIRFFIAPYFWETFSFQFITAAILIFVLILTTRVINKRKYERKIKILEAEKALEKERIRISSDMHDELGAGLTKVSVLLGMAKEDLKNNPEQDKQIQKIINATQDIEDTMDEIIWSVDPKYDNLSELMNFVTNYAQTYFEDTGIRPRFDLPIDIPDYHLSVEQRHQILSIIKEAFTNIAKHSGASEIVIKLETSSNAFEISITDNGRGFNLENIDSTRHGLENMQSRAKLINCKIEIYSEDSKGSIIKLSIPK